MMRDDPYENPYSLPYKFRQRRFKMIAAKIDKVLAEKGECRILDIGGEERYWNIGRDYLRDTADKIHITLLNLKVHEVANKKMFVSLAGDACNIDQFADNSFDLVHSNSVIEHVGTWERMTSMAKEVRRLAPHYFIQTPYFWFPFEPHYTSVGYHWLPQNIQARRLMSRGRGFNPKACDIDGAMRIVQHTVLLDKQQFIYLFPDASMPHEKVLGITKSLIASR